MTTKNVKSSNKKGNKKRETMSCLPYSAGEQGSKGEISHFSPPVFLLRKNPAPSSEEAVYCYILVISPF